ncbi:hypothetical protein [Streptomyces canus]|uniref:hypothetical protein n=1 Tax=Streptomyces canus TaxID=58343 RepID=UPI0030E5A4BA
MSIPSASTTATAAAAGVSMVDHLAFGISVYSISGHHESSKRSCAGAGEFCLSNIRLSTINHLVKTPLACLLADAERALGEHACLPRARSVSQ